MESQSKSDAARANGAKSHGPTTPEGKARSSQNAVKHGLTATFKVLPGESEQDFEHLLEAHRTHHQPATALEEELVRNLAVARWRLARVAALETNLFDNELSRAEKEIDEEFSEITDLGKLAHVFSKLADHSHALSLLIRYENSLTRTCDRLFKHLLTIQKLRNEPKPEPEEHSAIDRNRPSRVTTSIPSDPDFGPPPHINATESSQTTREGGSLCPDRSTSQMPPFLPDADGSAGELRGSGSPDPGGCSWSTLLSGDRSRIGGHLYVHSRPDRQDFGGRPGA